MENAMAKAIAMVIDMSAVINHNTTISRTVYIQTRSKIYQFRK